MVGQIEIVFKFCAPIIWKGSLTRGETGATSGDRKLFWQFASRAAYWERGNRCERHSQGLTKAHRWHPICRQSTARQSLMCGLGALGSQWAADLRKAWPLAGDQRWAGDQSSSFMELSGKRLRDNKGRE